MKKINLLLPLATLGAMTAVAVPLTSCGTTGDSYDALVDVDTTGWELYDDLPEILETDVPMHYAKAIEKDSTIFKKDLIWGKRQFVKEWIGDRQSNPTPMPEVPDVERANYVINNLSVSIFDEQIFLDLSLKADVKVSYYINDVKAYEAVCDVSIDVKQWMPTFSVSNSLANITLIPIPPDGGDLSPEAYFAIMPEAHYNLITNQTVTYFDEETGDAIQSISQKISLIQDKDNLTNIEMLYESPAITFVKAWPLYYFSETYINVD